MTLAVLFFINGFRGYKCCFNWLLCIILLRANKIIPDWRVKPQSGTSLLCKDQIKVFAATKLVISDYCASIFEEYNKIAPSRAR